MTELLKVTRWTRKTVNQKPCFYQNMTGGVENIPHPTAFHLASVECQFLKCKRLPTGQDFLFGKLEE